MFIRIGIGEGSWIGSFERGHATVSTIYMMPDRKHLFVSADGAGYIIEAKSRTLVEAVGTEVVGVMRDKPLTVFIVSHKDMSLEASERPAASGKRTPSVPEDFEDWPSPTPSYSAKRVSPAGGIGPASP